MTEMTRTLTLSAPAGEPELARMAEAEGVVAVRACRGGLRITYDLRKTGMTALEKAAVQAGLTPSPRLLARLARAWAAFQDENLGHQARLEHRCCGTPPRA